MWDSMSAVGRDRVKFHSKPCTMWDFSRILIIWAWWSYNMVNNGANPSVILSDGERFRSILSIFRSSWSFEVLLRATEFIC